MQTKGQLSFQDNQTDSELKQLLQDILSDRDSKTRPKSENKRVEEAEEEGHEDFIKEDVKESEKNVQKLDSLAENAEFVLFRTKSVNPFDFFPDEIIIDTNKVSIIQKTFFVSERIHSVMLTDVSDVFIDTGLFFAKLSIIDKGFVQNSVDVEYLSKDHAAKVRRLIQGLMVAKQQEIDFSNLRQSLSETEIIEKVEKLGKARIGD